MSFDENNFDDNLDDEQLPEESNNNRTFLIAAGILGGIILLSVACFVAVYLFTQNANSQAESQAAAITQTAAVASNFINEALTSTAEAAIFPTATEPPVVNVATMTSTPDPNASPTVGAGTPAAATATVGAALTQAAIAQLTIIPTTTALPQTGFIEDFGIPGLAVMALAFIIVILMARRLRVAPTR